MKNSDTLKLAKLKERLTGKSEITLNSDDYAELLGRCIRLQTALEESEHQYYDLAESLPQTIFEVDLDGNLKYSNAHGLRAWGYTLKDVEKGLNIIEIFIPRDNLRLKENLRRLLNGEKFLGQEYTALRKDGSVFPVMIFSNPIKRDNHPVALRGIIIDISERKRYEESLRLSEEKYRTLFDQKLDGVMVIDETLKILLANSAAAEILGFESAGELKDLNFLDVIRVDREYRFHDLININNIFDSNLEQTNEIRCRKRSGAEIWIALICNTISYQGKLAGLASFRDITLQKQTDEDLRRSRVEIQNLYAHSHMVREEERKLIAHEIHDELGQVLTALQIDLYWLQKRLAKDNGEIQEKTKAMSLLISESIASVQRICSKLSPPILDELGIVATLEWQATEFEKHIGIACEFHSKIDELKITRECSIAIFRIVQEALTNVARHAQASRVSLRLSRKNGNLLVKIVDNGKGITQNQISSSYSYGLLGMKERALAFGGEFEIRRGRRNGTTVTFSIPIERSGASLDEEDISR
jgi:PAS domain S-box-containing protein